MAGSSSELRREGQASVDDLLTELFSSRVRAVVLGYLLPRPHLGFSLTDLSRALGLPISSLQHECYKLERIGVLTGQRRGNAYLYRPEATCRMIRPLTRLVVAGIGEEAALRATLDGVPGLDVCFLGGTLLGDQFSPRSPLPLVLIGDISLEALDATHERAALLLGLPLDAVEPVYYPPEDWRSRRRGQSAYVNALLNGPRTDLVGSAESLTQAAAS
jgi:hypothetical protein